jgi:hypothetical protein
VADALQAAEIFFGPRDETGERTGFGDETAGEREHVLAAGAAAEEHGEELGVAEGAGTVFFETLLGAFARGGFAEAVGRGRGSGVGGGVGHGFGLDRFRAAANPARMNPLRVVVWGENIHEQQDAAVAAIYPQGMHTAIADGIRENLPGGAGDDGDVARAGARADGGATRADGCADLVGPPRARAR